MSKVVISYDGCGQTCNRFWSWIPLFLLKKRENVRVYTVSYTHLNVLCAEVQLEEGVSMTELDIRRYLKDYLQDFKSPRRIKFVYSFALTRTGKLKRS